MEDKLRILVLDDDDLQLILIQQTLGIDYNVITETKPSAALDLLANEVIDIIISDFRMPEMNGISFVAKAKEIMPSVEIIMMSAEVILENVIPAMRLGVVDFLKKPFEINELKIAIERTIKFTELKRKIRRSDHINLILNNEIKEIEGFQIISQSEQMQKVKSEMIKVAKSPDTSVIITGESGTGKELIARGIHDLSDRKKYYFAAVNSSAIPDQLFESEFFGHKKGAFTGAISDREGWFSVANNGTLFLDEIGDMQPSLQIKLLRVLEERKYVPVGSQKEQSFNVRIIAATNKKVEQLKTGNDFRLDLFHRLGTFEIYVPPLRERKEDIPLLVNHFLNFFTKKTHRSILKIEKEAMNLLLKYNYPGNVRELRNIIERAVILCNNDTLSIEHFSLLEQNSPDSNENDMIFDLEKIEKETILQALKFTGNNKSEAAKLLNIKWNALHRRLQKFGIEI